MKVAESTADKKVWSSQSCLGLPASPTHAAYTLYWMALWFAAWWAVVYNHGAARVTTLAGVPVAEAVGFLDRKSVV